MVAGAATGQLSLAAQRRVELAGKGGFVSHTYRPGYTFERLTKSIDVQFGLVENRKVFGLAVFASLGGLLYGMFV